jgi:hypothetical protein
MRVLQGILNESKEYYVQIEKDILNRLSRLAQGNIKKRIVNGKEYFYLQKRNKEKVEQKYIGKVFPEKIAKEVKERGLLQKELKKVRESLKILKRLKFKEYDSIIGDIRKQARAAGLKRSDIPTVVKKVRGK